MYRERCFIFRALALHGLVKVAEKFTAPIRSRFELRPDFCHPGWDDQLEPIIHEHHLNRGAPTCRKVMEEPPNFV